MLTVGASAAEQPAPEEAAYWRVVTEYYPSTLSPEPQHREIWIGNNRPGVLLDTGVDDGAAITLDEGHWFLAGSWSGFTNLPTDPDQLERELLTESPAPPLVRAALWQVLAGILGITCIGPTTDSAGRPGVALARNGFRLVGDPDRSAARDEHDGGAIESGAGRRDVPRNGPRAESCGRRTRP